MLQATEQQLSLVTRKVQRLEGSVQGQIDRLKLCREQRGEALHRVEDLRAQLAQAEEIADKLCKEHDEVQALLKQNAEEYASAQLLQKRYQNTLQTLQGHCRSFVRLLGADRGSQNFVIADDCTVNSIDRKKSFVVDSVFDDSALNPHQLDTAVNTEGMVADVLSGTNVGFMTFGPARSGKSSFLFGASAAEVLHNGASGSAGGRAAASTTHGIPSDNMSVFGRFVQHLFDSLEANEVTHFNIRCSFAELSQEQLLDLLSEYGGVSSMLGYRGGVASGTQSLSDLCSVQVQSAADVLHLLHNGLQRVAQMRGGGGNHSSGHLVFSLLVENFNTKGNFRRGTSTFVDLSGTAYNPHSSSALQGGGISPEHLWAHKSLTALCDVITMLSAANQQQLQATGHPLSVPMTDVPHRHNRLIQLLREFLGGNCKTTMLCCVNTRINTVDEILSALSYAYYFKSVKNFPIPYDIPPELQRLNLQMNRYADED
jgi:hypothetical protein